MVEYLQKNNSIYQYAGVVSADDDDIDNVILSKHLKILQVADIQVFNTLSGVKSYFQIAIGNCKLPALVFLNYLFIDEPSFCLLEFLEKNAKDIMAKRVIFTSHCSDPRMIAKAKSYTCVADFIEKPFTNEEIANTIKKYLK
jgi:FixJ family two-component response regulator